MAESNVFVRFGADIDPLKKGVNEAKGKIGQFGKSTLDAANKTAKLTAAATAAGLAIATKMVSSSLDAIDAQAKLARQLGTSTVSLSTLERAADMSGISMKNIEQGAKNLEVALGEAASGTGLAVDTLERLNLTAQDLQGLSLDEKILTVNRALKENIPATERAAAASDLFGKKAGFAITQLNADTIKIAKEEVVGFGVALSDFDSAKIEAANDAMATIGVATKGVSNQLTVVLAPILEDMAKQFKDAAIETGGFKTQAIDAVNSVGAAVGFLGNAFRGIEVAIAGLNVGFHTLKTGALGIGAIFSDEMEAAAQSSAANMALAIDEMNAKLMEPLPSETIEAYIASFTDPAILEAKQAQNDAMQAIDDSNATHRINQEEKVQSALQKLRDSWQTTGRKGTQQFFSDLSTLTQSGNKKLFEIGKAAARVNVAIDTNEAAMKAYKWAAGWGGPIAGGVAAAAAIAAGGIRLQAINSTSFGGGGGSASAYAGGGSAAATTAAAPQAPEQNRTVRIEGFDSGQLYTGDQLQSLAENLVELQNDGFKLVV